MMMMIIIITLKLLLLWSNEDNVYLHRYIIVCSTYWMNLRYIQIILLFYSTKIEGTRDQGQDLGQARASETWVVLQINDPLSAYSLLLQQIFPFCHINWNIAEQFYANPLQRHQF